MGTANRKAEYIHVRRDLFLLAIGSSPEQAKRSLKSDLAIARC